MFAAPPRVEAEVFTTIPEKFWKLGERSYWGSIQFPGADTPTFLEGPSFDTEGNLWVVDIPWGRLFKIAPDGEVSLGAEYDGEKLRRARAEYAAYVELASSDPDRAAEYAEGIASAKEEIAAIDADLARKALLRARFYRRSGRDAAALTVLREAARRWGETGPGRECARRAGDLAAELGEPPAPETPPEPEEPPK